MSCRRVIVNSVDEWSDYYKMFPKEDIGLSASNEDPNEVADKILTLYKDRELIEHFADNAKAYGFKYYSRTVNTRKYEELYLKMSKSK